MTRSSSRKHKGTSTARIITGLAISTAVLLTGTVYGYAAVGTNRTHSTSASVYGPSLLKGPLADTSVGAGTETATFSVGGPSHLKGPLK